MANQTLINPTAGMSYMKGKEPQTFTDKLSSYVKLKEESDKREEYKKHQTLVTDDPYEYYVFRGGNNSEKLLGDDLALLDLMKSEIYENKVEAQASNLGSGKKYDGWYLTPDDWLMGQFMEKHHIGPDVVEVLRHDNGDVYAYNVIDYNKFEKIVNEQYEKTLNSYATEKYGDSYDPNNSRLVFNSAVNNGVVTLTSSNLLQKELPEPKSVVTDAIKNRSPLNGSVLGTALNNPYSLESTLKNLLHPYDGGSIPEYKVSEKTVEEVKEAIFSNNGDKRVSLNVVPLDRNTIIDNGVGVQAGTSYITQEEFDKRLRYVLGPYTGFLYHVFAKTAGLVFPYTPKISMQHQTNYENTQIPHSNISFQQYQNTSLPTISITATFTADTPLNAQYMLGAIWFFRALSKCEFGKNSKTYLGSNDEEEFVAGMTPPVLYLNGWGQLIDNTPVVITSFDISLPDDIQYVKLSGGYPIYDDKGQIIRTFDYSGSTDQWLPTMLTMNIGLAIQPNLNKYKNQFSLDKYKSGVLGGMEPFDYLGHNSSGIKLFYMNDDGSKGSDNYYVLDNVPKETVKKFKILSDKNSENGFKVEMYNDNEKKRYNGSGWTW